MAARGKVEQAGVRHIPTRRARHGPKPCDYLACGFGLVPNLELASLLGCAMSAAGVAVDEYQQSSVPGVYCAGEITGIGGLDLALAEGEIAGYAAAGKSRSRAQTVRRARFAPPIRRCAGARLRAARGIARAGARRYVGLPLRRCAAGPRPAMLELARSQAAHALRHGAVPGPRLRSGGGVSAGMEAGIGAAAGVRGAGREPRGMRPLRQDRIGVTESQAVVKACARSFHSYPL